MKKINKKIAASREYVNEDKEHPIKFILWRVDVPEVLNVQMNEIKKNRTIFVLNSFKK